MATDQPTESAAPAALPLTAYKGLATLLTLTAITIIWSELATETDDDSF